MSLVVQQSGILSLLQDQGRHGYHRLGLSNGGAMDSEAYQYCNRLLDNLPNSTVIEISVGGLQLAAQVDTFICLTGATMPLKINQRELDAWAVHKVLAGDIIEIGFASSGCRGYLGVADGFDITPRYSSTATVVREHIGGLNGASLQAGDRLPCAVVASRKRRYLLKKDQPRYQTSLTLRVIPGYQRRCFSRTEKRRFFASRYQVSEHCDRMGYRLKGPAISCNISNVLSEGIGFGAIQLPPDGQPIVLLNDRQTIGGYPKIGTVFSLDAARLTQLTPGCSVHFAPISHHTARRALQLAHQFRLQTPLQEAKN